MSKKEEAILRLKVEFTVEDCDRGQLLRIPETGQVLLLNESAARVLHSLKSGASRQGVVQDLMEYYEVETERVRSDVDRCLHDLVNLGMLKDARF